MWRQEVGVISEVERRDGYRASTSRRRSGGRGIGSGKRRRNSQPVEDIRVRILRWGDKNSLLEMKSGEKASLETKSNERLCWR